MQNAFICMNTQTHTIYGLRDPSLSNSTIKCCSFQYNYALCRYDVKCFSENHDKGVPSGK